MELPLLSIVTLSPLAGALLIMMCREDWVKAIQRIAILSTGIPLSLALALFGLYLEKPAAGFEWIEQADWFPALGITYKLGADGLSIVMALLTAIISFTGVWISLGIRTRHREYFALALTSMTGVFGVFLSLDLFFLILFYELASVPMFFLVGIWGSDKTGEGKPILKERAAMKLLLYLQLGGGLVLMGILGLYFASGLGSFDFTVLQTANFSQKHQVVLFLLLFIGFGIEAGLVPFHTWLPEGHSSAPTALSMLLAGVLLKMGGYGILRLGIQLLPDGAEAVMPWFVLLALTNVIYGGLCALRQTDIKVMIAYSSVSHMGMVFLGLACVNAPDDTSMLYGLTGAVFQMFSHGIITALLFALGGTIYAITHTRDLRKWGGLASRMPWFATLYMLAAMASLGLPGMTGFVAELMVFLGTWGLNPAVTCVAVCGLIITTTYLLRSVGFGFYGPLNPDLQGVRDARLEEGFPMGILALTTLVFGIAPSMLIATVTPTLKQVAERLLQ